MRREKGLRWPFARLLTVTIFLFACGPAVSAPLASLIRQCAACHGVNGNSPMAGVPSIAGQPELFILDQLVYMREGVRPADAMAPLVKPLSDDDIVGLAKHYAALPPRRSGEITDRALVERGAALARNLRCASCHGATYAGQEQIPRLAKQRIDYMTTALLAYRDNKRRGGDTIMNATLFGLSDEDLRALAHYTATR